MRRLALVILVALSAAHPLTAQTRISARSAEITLGGRLHSQFETSSVDGEGSNFFLRRARFNAEVTVADAWDARIQIEFGRGRAGLEDAWVRYAFAPGFRVSFGQFNRAFDMFQIGSSTDQSIIERDGGIEGVSVCTGIGGMCSYGRFTSRLGQAGRDQGVRVEAGSGRLRFMGTVTNGTGANTADVNGGKSFAGRFTYAATDALTVGAGLGVHDRDVAGETEYSNAWSADLNYGTWRDGLHLQAAVTGGENWAAPNAPDFLTWQVVGTYYAPIESARLAGIEPVLRISSGDPDTALDDDGGFVFTPGLMFYLSGRNRIGFNLDYWSPQSGDSAYSLKVQSYVYF